MEAWLYDEDRWPSGFAGGYVTKKVSNRLGYLFFQEAKSLQYFKWTSQSIALFKCKKINGVYENIKNDKRILDPIKNTHSTWPDPEGVWGSIVAIPFDKMNQYLYLVSSETLETL